ncbi:MAG: hypothetical protein IPM50_07135 [Acidobacteriota bacterium]|nr:MAG: hypothetical protein IPM50_07135 [Acidobacteriota bacterium]
MNEIENYENIYYLEHPHFTVGHVDQWGESGYLYFEGKVYSYEEDRKCQYGRTYSPMTINEFIAYAARYQIEIPQFFLDVLDNAAGNSASD